MIDVQEYRDAVREPACAVEDLHCRRVLLVGEVNPLSSRRDYALVNYPDGCAGHRMQAKVAGLPEGLYLALWRTNLCVGRWSMKDARARADELLAPPEGCPSCEHSRAEHGYNGCAVKVGSASCDDAYCSCSWEPKGWDVVVMLGRKVASAFDHIVSVKPFDAKKLNGRVIISLPHPSGLCRDWYRAGAFDNARDVLIRYAHGVPWGKL